MGKQIITKVYPDGSPEKCMADFLNAWYEKDWNRMAENCQKSWIPEEKLIDNKQVIKEMRAIQGWKPLTDKEMSKVTPFILLNAFENLKNKFEGMKIHIASIKKVYMDDGLDPNVITDVLVNLHYSASGAKGIFNGDFRFRIVKEKEKHQPSKDGGWGVNPSSFRPIKK